MLILVVYMAAQIYLIFDSSTLIYKNVEVYI